MTPRTMTTRPPARALALAAAAVLALGACSDTSNGATTTPTTSPAVTSMPSSPTLTSSPTLSTTSTATPSASYDQALVAEATKVNKAQLELEGLYFKQGGWPRGLKIPTELTDLMMDEGLKRTVENLNQTWEKKIVHQSGDMTMTDIEVSGAAPHKDSVIALQACRDGRQVRSLSGEGQTPSQGALLLHTSYYKRDTDGKLKMSYWTGKRVEACGS